MLRIPYCLTAWADLSAVGSVKVEGLLRGVLRIDSNVKPRGQAIRGVPPVARRVSCVAVVSMIATSLFGPIYGAYHKLPPRNRPPFYAIRFGIGGIGGVRDERIVEKAPVLVE